MTSNSRSSVVPGSSHHGGSSNNQPLSVADQLMQLDSAITSTLQEIDANFAKAHQIVTSVLLPAVKLYGQHSARTWHSAKLWQEFFITAANIGSRQHQGDEEYAETDKNADSEEEEDAADSTLPDPLQTSAGQSSRSRTGKERDQPDDNDSGSFFETIRNAHASSPIKHSRRGDAGTVDEETSWAAMESPFERLKKELAQQSPGEFNAHDRSMSQAEVALARQKAKAEASRKQKASAGHEENEEEDDNVDGQDDAAHGIDKLHLTDLPVIRSPAKLRQTPRLLHRVLQSEQSKANKGGSTPARGTSKRPAQAKWDGLADLTKTPLSTQKQASRSRTAAKGAFGDKGKAPLSASWRRRDESFGDSSDDSLAWPAGMSPPVTMQFSVPRSRFAKTPAKEAAKLLMDDLLRTAEAGPATVRRELERRAKQREYGEAEPSSALRKGPHLGSTSRDDHLGIPSSSSSKLYSAAATPLKKGPLGRVRKDRRDSMPTPPTITRPVGSILLGSKAQKDGQTPLGNVSGVSLSSTTGAGARGRAAMLLDEGEDGEDGDLDIIGDLTAGALSAPRTDLDSLLRRTQTSGAGDDSESDTESDDEDSDYDDSEDDVPRSRVPSAAANADSGGTWTGSSIGSKVARDSHIDNDTLFGIGGAGGGASGGGSGSGNTSRALQQDKTIARATATASSRPSDEFKLRGGPLEDTIRGGKLLEERDLTYSAPSPTPVPSSMRGS